MNREYNMSSLVHPVSYNRFEEVSVFQNKESYLAANITK